MSQTRKVNVPLLRLRELRKASNWSMQELAANLGVRGFMVAAWESGRATMSPKIWANALRLLGRPHEDMPLHGRMFISEAPERYRIPTNQMKRVRELRHMALKTQTELAEALGVRTATVAAWETGKARIPPLTWYKLLKLADMPRELPPDSDPVYDPDKPAKAEKVKKIDPATVPTVPVRFLPKADHVAYIQDKLREAGAAYVDKPATDLALRVAFAFGYGLCNKQLEAKIAALEAAIAEYEAQRD